MPDDAVKEDAGLATAHRGTTIAGDRLPRVDFLSLDDLLTPAEREVRDRVRAWVDASVTPIIAPYWERGEFPTQLLPQLQALGVIGGTLREHGCPGLSAVASGLVCTELSRGDASVGTFFSIQSGLVMATIALCGSVEQQARWLPPLARLECIGAFALTEPLVGSDASHLETRARRDGTTYVLDGAKRWIGLGDVAGLFIIWARDDSGQVGAFLVEAGAPGLTVQRMEGKVSLRSLGNADLTLQGVRVGLEQRLERVAGFRSVTEVLTRARYGIACGALGNAVACYEAALAYALKRRQFGKPIAAFQLVQQKLVWMLTEISAMQLLCWRLGRLVDEGSLTPEQAAMGKLNHAAKARQIAAAARDLLGGNGILLTNLVARHQADLEAVYSYEGADHIQTLLIGRALTGLSAFA